MIKPIKNIKLAQLWIKKIEEIINCLIDIQSPKLIVIASNFTK